MNNFLSQKTFYKTLLLGLFFSWDLFAMDPISQEKSFFNWLPHDRLASIIELSDEEVLRQIVRHSDEIQDDYLATQAVIKLCDMSNPQEVLSFLISRVENNESFALATHTAQICMHHDNWVTRHRALILLQVLVEKGHGFDVAINAAHANIHDRNQMIAQCALSVFRALVEKDQGFDAAMDAAHNLINNDDTFLRTIGLSLFTALVRKDQGIDAAINIARDNINSDNQMIAQFAGILLQELLAKVGSINLGIDSKAAIINTAIDAADNQRNHDNQTLRFVGARLFSALIKTARDNINSENQMIAQLAETLRQNLLDRGFEV